MSFPPRPVLLLLLCPYFTFYPLASHFPVALSHRRVPNSLYNPQRNSDTGINKESKNLHNDDNSDFQHINKDVETVFGRRLGKVLTLLVGHALSF